jgi:hypothetical protein
MKFFVYIFVFFSWLSNANSEISYPFNLKVYSSNPLIADAISSAINNATDRFSNLHIDDENFSVQLYVISEQRTGSKINKDGISFSIVHTTTVDAVALTKELLGENGELEQTDYIMVLLTNILFSQGVVKYINVASVDNLSGVDDVARSIVGDLSVRIQGYLE